MLSKSINVIALWQSCPDLKEAVRVHDCVCMGFIKHIHTHSSNLQPIELVLKMTSSEYLLHINIKSYQVLLIVFAG